MKRRCWHRLSIALAAVAWVAAPAAHGADVEPGWRLRVSVASMDFDSNLSGGSGYGIDLGAAAGVNAEYRFSRRLGLDLGAFGGGGVDIAGHRSWVGWVDYRVYDTMSVNGVSVGLDVHLTPDSRVDLYLCPMVAMMQFGGLSFAADSGQLRTAIDFDEDLAIGASLGLGVPFGDRRNWSFNAYLTHLESTLNGHERGDLRIEEDYDAKMFGLGLGYRF